MLVQQRLSEVMKWLKKTKLVHNDKLCKNLYKLNIKFGNKMINIILNVVYNCKNFTKSNKWFFFFNDEGGQMCKCPETQLYKSPISVQP